MGVRTAALVATVLFGVTGAEAAEVRLGWLPVPGSAGYRTFLRPSDQPYGPGSDVGYIAPDASGIVHVVIQDVEFGTPTYFAVTSYDAKGVESSFSNELVLMLCPSAPIAGCRAPTEPRASVLSVRDGIDAKRDRLIWKWRKGAAISAQDLGVPTASTSYLLCVYDDARGGPSLAAGIAFQAGGPCNAGDPCWRDRGRRGFTYANRPATGGSLGVKLKPGAAGKGSIRVSIKGGSLALSLPGPADSLFQQDPAVTVQLLNDANPPVCWEAAYGAAARVHGPTRFKDASD